MDVNTQIENYLQSLPDPKQSELRTLQSKITELMPGAKLWYLDGKDETGKVVSNPNIGFGSQISELAGGKTREFYRIGLSANTAGISVYIMGIADRKQLPETFAKTIGKASVTGYCIKFKTIGDIDLKVLSDAILVGVNLGY